MGGNEEDDDDRPALGGTGGAAPDKSVCILLSAGIAPFIAIPEGIPAPRLVPGEADIYERAAGDEESIIAADVSTRPPSVVVSNSLMNRSVTRVKFTTYEKCTGIYMNWLEVSLLKLILNEYSPHVHEMKRLKGSIKQKLVNVNSNQHYLTTQVTISTLITVSCTLPEFDRVSQVVVL